MGGGARWWLGGGLRQRALCSSSYNGSIFLFSPVGHSRELSLSLASNATATDGGGQDHWQRRREGPERRDARCFRAMRYRVSGLPPLLLLPTRRVRELFLFADWRPHVRASCVALGTPAAARHPPAAPSSTLGVAPLPGFLLLCLLPSTAETRRGMRGESVGLALPYSRSEKPESRPRNLGREKKKE